MKNYSRQREAILQVLRSTDTHPSASAVYNEVRKLIPNISLGTVYRNLAALAEDGSVLSLSVGDGYEHFDGTLPHTLIWHWASNAEKFSTHRLSAIFLPIPQSKTALKAKLRYI